MGIYSYEYYDEVIARSKCSGSMGVDLSYH